MKKIIHIPSSRFLFFQFQRDKGIQIINVKIRGCLFSKNILCFFYLEAIGENECGSIGREYRRLAFNWRDYCRFGV